MPLFPPTGLILSSGEITSGYIGDAAVLSGSVGSGQIGLVHLASGTLLIGSGLIESGSVQGFFGAARNIASGTVGVFDFGSGAVVAGAVGSGAVVSGNIGSGQVGSLAIASGAVSSGRIGITAGAPDGTRFLRDDYAWATPSVGSGVVSSGDITSGAVQGFFGSTRNIASGTLGVFDLGSGAIMSGSIASGAVITYARDVIADNFTCTEAISGVRCVTFDPSGSGQVRIAMAAVSGRMPAIGVVFEPVASGDACKVVMLGHVVPPGPEMGSGVCISGRVGKSLWVGASGQLVVLSGGGPTIGVGASNSGSWGQRMGTSALSGTVLVQMNPNVQFSGAANLTTNPQQWPI